MLVRKSKLMSKQAYFITGTDTSAGKTVVTAALIKYLQKGGLRVAGLKPIASGFDWLDGQLKNDDVESIKAASNVVLGDELINRYSYRQGIAPHIAAQQHGEQIHLDKIVDDAQHAFKSLDALVVEGVGGWLVPLHGAGQSYQNIQDLALQLQFPVILVVGMRLGCINHALLTAQAISMSGVLFSGWVANFCDPNFECQKENLAILDERMPVPRLFDMPYLGSSQDSVEIIPHSE